MSDAEVKYHGYSADVRMELCVNGRILRIGQLGPDFLILDDPADHPAGRAEIQMSIDGRVRRWPVHLPDGVSTHRLRTRLERSFVADQE
jgi:hypothetical protein